MALRVLLADESSTIKRVIQLALQDYAVDVKSIPIGLDVLPVTKTYKPDVIFADILLPKRSGYDVCSDLKNDPETKNIPVILMWSSFMELDQAKATQCRADGRLEKPFETEQLRTLTQNLVPKLKSNPISSYLKFPKLPDFAEPTAPNAPTAEFNVFSIPEAPEVETGFIPFEMNTTDEAFQQVPLHNEAPKVTQPRTESVKIHLGEESPWSKQDIAEFQLNPAPSQSSESSFEELKYETVQPSKVTSAQLPTALNIAITEKVLREEAQKMLESMIWKILPEIAERVVKEEINKLLQETEKSI